MVKSADIAIIGGGVIGLSLACELRRSGASVMVLERNQPGREASWAAGGMIAYTEVGPNPLFRRLAKLSAEMYAGFVHTLQDESGVNIDLRTEGKILFLDKEDSPAPEEGSPLSDADLQLLEPQLEYRAPAVMLPEVTIDPHALMEALIKSALHLGVDLVSGANVQQIEITNQRASTVVTSKAQYAARVFVNCAGAWAGEVAGVPIPVKPIKGHMLSVVSHRPLLRHVVHGNGVYLIPRGDGRIVMGSTIEDVGFDKRVDTDVIQRMHQAAAILVPEIGQARIHDSWAGLRPCSPDKLPILGKTSLDGYIVATGHYRDGIMLAPITARLISQIISGQQPEIDVSNFSLSRFQS
jgi:glycine oxidase